jgi:beta-phosphoglucomutase-like phosphatase (HAD superfamily)
MEKDFALGIVSMARREELEYILDKIGLRDCFSIIVSAEDVSNHKPNPECYLKGFSLLDRARTRTGKHHPIVQGECLVVEDSPQGIMAGRAAGSENSWRCKYSFSRKIERSRSRFGNEIARDWMPDTIRRVFV